MNSPSEDTRLKELKRLLWPIEWEHLKDWHKNSARWSSQSDDFVGARVHRERFRAMDALEKANG